MTTTEAIVLVGGLGTRLREVVGDVPKPLAPVAGRPFLAWLLDQLERKGIRRVVLAAGYQAGLVQRAIGGQWGTIDIDYSIEESPLGTGGALRQACGRVRSEAVHVLNGDTFLDYDLAAMEASTRHAGAQLGVALACVPDVSRYGAVERNPSGIITAFREKAKAGAGHVNAGCYFLVAEAIAALPRDHAYSFEKQVLEPMGAAGLAYGHVDTRDFIDIGVPDDYRRAQQWFGPSNDRT